MSIAPDLLKPLTYSRYLLNKAHSLQAAGSELASADAVLAAHDAAEILMRVAAITQGCRYQISLWSSGAG
jgi:hypothetical protein